MAAVGAARLPGPPPPETWPVAGQVGKGAQPAFLLRHLALYCARENHAKRGTMVSKPIILKLMCVALVTSVVFPLGRMAYPYVAHDISDISFGAIQAIFTTTLGMGIYAIFFV
jgi:hypothetical protein